MASPLFRNLAGWKTGRIAFSVQKWRCRKTEKNVIGMQHVIKEKNKLNGENGGGGNVRTCWSAGIQCCMNLLKSLSGLGGQSINSLKQ